LKKVDRSGKGRVGPIGCSNLTHRFPLVAVTASRCGCIQPPHNTPILTPPPLADPTHPHACVCSNTPASPHGEAGWAAWQQRRRHFFVLTAAGKPVYSRHGDEQALAGMPQLRCVRVFRRLIITHWGQLEMPLLAG
jgi:hypothetical protein